MRVKRFTAETVRGAVGLVKAEFGEDALIIETRRVRRGGLLRWLRAPQYEVLAAVEGSPARPRASRDPQSTEDAGGASGQVASVPTASQTSTTSVSLAQGAVEGGGSPQPSNRLLAHLLVQGVYEPLARAIARETEIRAQLSGAAGDWESVLKASSMCMVQGLRCVRPEAIGEDGRVIPLIGPTGVGKTTTIAKLAANFALLGQKRVAVITTDTYRIGAVEQLRTYTELIGVPLNVVYTPQQLAECVQRHNDKDLIFVDTAGRSQHHDEQLQELASFLEVLSEPCTHLVVSATTKVDDAIDVVRRFETVGYQRIIVSKVDETRTLGTVYTVVVQSKRPLVYLTTGQGVPDDIEVADADRIVKHILEGAHTHGSGPAA